MLNCELSIRSHIIAEYECGRGNDLYCWEYSNSKIILLPERGLNPSWIPVDLLAYRIQDIGYCLYNCCCVNMPYLYSAMYIKYRKNICVVVVVVVAVVVVELIVIYWITYIKCHCLLLRQCIPLWQNTRRISLSNVFYCIISL